MRKFDLFKKSPLLKKERRWIREHMFGCEGIALGMLLLYAASVPNLRYPNNTVFFIAGLALPFLGMLADIWVRE